MNMISCYHILRGKVQDFVVLRVTGISYQINIMWRNLQWDKTAVRMVAEIGVSKRRSDVQTFV